MFNIVLDEQSDNDVVEKIQDITFMIDKELVDEYEGFVVLSTEENDGRGLSLKSVLDAGGGCSSCGGGCH